MSTKKKGEPFKADLPITNAIKAKADAPPAQQDVLQVETVEQFVQITQAWYEAKRGTLRHMLSIPTDGSITVEDPEGNKHELSGELAKGYMIALTTALGIFTELPFAETSDEPASGTAH